MTSERRAFRPPRGLPPPLAARRHPLPLGSCTRHASSPAPRRAAPSFAVAIVGDLHLEPGPQEPLFEEARRQLVGAVCEPGVAAPRVVQLGAWRRLIGFSECMLGWLSRGRKGGVRLDAGNHVHLRSASTVCRQEHRARTKQPAAPASALLAGDLGGYKFRPGSRECFTRGREYLAGFGLPTTLVTGNHECVPVRAAGRG